MDEEPPRGNATANSLLLLLLLLLLLFQLTRLISVSQDFGIFL